MPGALPAIRTLLGRYLVARLDVYGLGMAVENGNAHGRRIHEDVLVSSILRVSHTIFISSLV